MVVRASLVIPHMPWLATAKAGSLATEFIADFVREWRELAHMLTVDIHGNGIIVGARTRGEGVVAEGERRSSSLEDREGRFSGSSVSDELVKQDS